MALFTKFRRSSTPGDDRLGNDTPASVPERLIAQGRYAQVVNRQNAHRESDRIRALAWLALERDMAFVPAPELGDQNDEGTAEEANSQVPSIYLDRHAVTNAEFARFVADDGYGQLDLWPQSIWPNLVQFVDSTGYPGPRFWTRGKPDAEEERRPVVGVNWFEARAYARWCGKRLPTSKEWEHAGSWCGGIDGRNKTSRYPWGNAFDHKCANIWVSGPGETVPVDEFEKGATPNGVYQLIGNVWEWVATQYEYLPEEDGLRVAFEEPMVEIRGGAFDTYFETQATCQFRTGQPFLYRGRNVGFRCCIPADHLSDPPPPTAFE